MLFLHHYFVQLEKQNLRMNLFHSVGPLPIYFGKSVCEQTVGRYLDIDLLVTV